MIGENFIQVLSDLESIRSQIDRFRQKLLEEKGIDFQKDVRYIFVNQLYNILTSHNLNIRYLIECISNKNWLKNNLSIDDNSTAFSIRENYIIYNKLSLIYPLSSISERLLRLIASNTMKEYKSATNFYTIRKNIFEQQNIGIETDIWKSLIILSKIRNTIHNNGVHTVTNKYDKKKEVIQYHNQVCSFFDETPQANSAYQIITLIIRDLLELSKLLIEKIQFYPIIDEAV